MNEVFLALLPSDGKDHITSPQKGMCTARWINDPLLIAQYIKEGWNVYRCNGFQLVDTFSIELKMGNKDECESSKSTKSDNKRGR